MSHFHSAVVTSAEHDNVYMCGFGRSGRLANSLDTCPQLRRVQGLRHRIVQVALGRDHTVFLTSRGEVLTCGSNRYGQLGRKATQIVDDEPVQLTPRTVPPPTRSFRAQGVAAAGYYTVVYNSDSMYTCGADQGQLGYRVDPQSNPWATDLVEPSLLSEFSELSLVTSPSSPHRGQQLAYQATLRQVTCFAADTQFISVVASEGALVCLLATNEVQILTKARSQMISLASGPTLIGGVRITHFHSRYVAPKPMEIATGERGLVAIVTNTGHIHVAHLPREFTADAPLSTTRDSSATMRQGPIFTPSRSHGAVRVWSALSDSLFAQKVAIGKGGTLILVTRNQRAYVGTLYRLPASSPLQCFYRFSLIPDLCYVTQVAANALGGFAAVQSTTRFAGDAPSVKDIGTRVRHTALLSPLGISGQRSVSLTELCHRDILHAHLRPTTRKTVSPDTPALHSFAQEEVSWRTLLRLKPPMVLYSELSDMVWATTTGDAVEVHTLRVASALPLFWHSVVTQLKCLSSPDTAGEQAAGFTVQVVDPSSSELPVPTECPPSLTRTAPFIYIHFHHCPFSVLAAIAYTLYQDTFPDGLPSDCHAMARRIRKAWQGDQAPIDSPLSACSLATTFNHLMVAVLRHITLPAGEAMLPPPLATLLQQRQWNTQEVICGYFDVVLRLQDALVPCHRWPLATGSAFFAMLLSPVSPWAHSSSASPVSHYSHSVNLTHVRWKTFFPVLVALYRGAQEDSLCAFPCEDTEQYLDYVLEVMSLADELDVPHLFRQCESTLVGLISIRTVIRFLDFTQRVIAPTLARCCEQFLRQHLLIFAERRALDQVPSPVLHHLTSPWGVENITCSNRQYAGSCHVESPDSPSCAVEAWAPTEKEWGEIVQFAYRQDLIGTTTLKSPRHAFTSGKSSPGRQRWQVEKTTQVSPSKEGIFSMDDEVNSSPVITHSPKPRRWLTLSPNGPRSPSGDRCPVSWQSSPITKVSLHTIVAEQQKQHNGDQPHPRQNVSIPTGLGTGNRIISFSPPGSAPLEPLAPQPHRSSQRQRRRQYQQQHSQSQKASGESSKTTWAQAAQPEESKSGNSPPTVLHPVPLTTRKAGSSRSQPGSKRILPNLPTASSLAIIQEEQAAENKRVEAKAQRVVQKGLSSIQREERARFEIGQYYALHSNTRAGEWFVLQ
ncbi:hypothetical protein IWQ62_002599 [Dispira parvispora]|uniref:BTB domain-containing protein n=1 Tax=Dispira parvispora TaxID=1520584 RepID=A0A9W8AQZ2_9FUNG|nr:hypothetical protein IWQ62_002599 [Dispira parvispora]